MMSYNDNRVGDSSLGISNSNMHELKLDFSSRQPFVGQMISKPLNSGGERDNFSQINSGGSSIPKLNN